jgi:hypothetical protein
MIDAGVVGMHQLRVGFAIAIEYRFNNLSVFDRILLPSLDDFFEKKLRIIV